MARANGSATFVNQQSGLFAGQGGYHVNAGTVALKGGAIASTSAANSDLTTNAISIENLANKMEYSADTMSLSGGVGGKLGQSSNGATGQQPNQQQSSNQPAPQLTNGAPNPNLTPGMMLMESASASSTTYGTLTEGNIKIGGQRTTAAATGAHTDLATASARSRPCLTCAS